MKVYYIIILLLLLSESCALFKKNTTKKSSIEQISTHKTDFKSTAELNQIKKSTKITAKNDSLQTNYKIHFFPKGKLSFSPQNFLTGEFDSVLIQGSLLEGRKYVAIQNVSVEGKGLIKNDLLIENQTVSKQEEVLKTSTIDMKWFISGFLLIFLILFLLLKKLKIV